jgi:hypothetical protein
MIEEATGTPYTGRNCLFPARGMRGQALAAYSEPCMVHHHKPCAVYGTDDIVIVRWERRPVMLLISTMGWIAIGVAAVILAVVIGTKIKEKYF